MGERGQNIVGDVATSAAVNAQVHNQSYGVSDRIKLGVELFRDLFIIEVFDLHVTNLARQLFELEPGVVTKIDVLATLYAEFLYAILSVLKREPHCLALGTGQEGV